MEQSIRLIDIQFPEVDCKIKIFDKEITEDLSTTLGIISLFDEEDNKKFAIAFDIKLENKKKNFKLKLKALAHFSSNTDVTTEFKNSSFIRISAPAIAFPYIRVFISNITLNAGYNPVVLPSFNFIKIAEENNNQ